MVSAGKGAAPSTDLVPPLMTNERIGILAAIVSSALGGMALGATRFVIGATDPVTLGAFRYCVGFVCLLPITLAARGRWPQRRDWPGVVLLRVVLFGILP